MKSKKFPFFQYQTKESVKRRKELVKFYLSPKKGKEYAEVVFFGDLHWGSPQCDKEKAANMLYYCYQKKIYVVLMGDIIEMATKNSVGAGVYEQEVIGQTQVEQIIDLFKPLAEEKLIIASLSGNHEERVYKDTGVDVASLIASSLNIPYLGDAGWLILKIGNVNYNVYILHGRTNSRFEGTALTALERLSSSFDADLIVMGHTHKLISSNIIIQKIKRNRVVENKKYLLISGSYLKYSGGYAQKAGMNIVKLGSPKVKFFATKKDIHISF